MKTSSSLFPVLARTVWPAIAVLAAAAIFTPRPAAASTFTSSLTPSWNSGVVQYQYWQNGEPVSAHYYCEIGIDHTLFAYTEHPIALFDETESSRIGLTFDVSDIPTTATITRATLSVDVRFPSPATIDARAAGTSNLAGYDCHNSTLYETLGGASYGQFSAWVSPGRQTLELDGVAAADIQRAVQADGSFSLGLSASTDDAAGIYAVAADVVHRPYLVVEYATGPGAPTDFNATSRTTSSVTWSWLDQAATETANQVRDSAQRIVCAAPAATGVGARVSCTESNLLPNTAVTRHPHVVDPEGIAIGGSVTAYTSIQSPTGIRITPVSPNSLLVSATGTFSNLTAGASGLFFQDTLSGRTSGWTQANAWLISGLVPNQKLNLRAMSRNGDGLGTAWSATTTAYAPSAGASITSARYTKQWYNTPVFKFLNAAGWGQGGVSFYRYAWNKSADHTFTASDASWSNASNNCPGSACKLVGNMATFTADSDGAWYLHIESLNGSRQTRNKITLGPYLYDGTSPSRPSATPSWAGVIRQAYVKDLRTIVASWKPASDTSSGIAGYQYALGTTPGGTEVISYADLLSGTNAKVTGLSLKNGTGYFLAVRSVDRAGNLGSPAISPRIIANAVTPRIVDRQSGDASHRRLPGTRYNVDFLKAPSGPAIVSAEYVVYLKRGMSGQQLIPWTKIFNSPRDTYTKNWPIKFTALKDGTYWVSVRVTALDGLQTVRKDVFKVVKDTSRAPHIRGVNVASFRHTDGVINVLIIGSGFRSDSRVYVGHAKATRVLRNRFGQLQATVSIAALKPGRYDLRVVNPNGLSSIRHNRIYLLR